MDVNIFDGQSTLTISSSQVKELVSEVLVFEKAFCDEVSIHFVDKEKISNLHGTYFNDPTPTDCISFPIDEEESIGYRVLGEVFVCPEVASEYANKHDIDPYEETSLYIVHGLLHLLGFDDIDEKDREEMRAAEKRNMINLTQHKLILKEVS